MSWHPNLKSRRVVDDDRPCVGVVVGESTQPSQTLPPAPGSLFTASIRHGGGVPSGSSPRLLPVAASCRDPARLAAALLVQKVARHAITGAVRPFRAAAPPQTGSILWDTSIGSFRPTHRLVWSVPSLTICLR